MGQLMQISQMEIPAPRSTGMENPAGGGRFENPAGERGGRFEGREI